MLSVCIKYLHIYLNHYTFLLFNVLLYIQNIWKWKSKKKKKKPDVTQVLSITPDYSIIISDIWLRISSLEYSTDQALCVWEWVGGTTGFH